MITAKSKEDIDLISIARAYGDLEKQGKEWYMVCPLPEHHDTNPSCAFNAEKQIWYCHGCQAGGDVFDLLMTIHHTDFPGALQVLREKHEINYSKDGSSPGQSKQKDALREVVQWAADMFHDALRGKSGLYDRNSEEHTLAARYLDNRGFNLGDINRWRLGFSPNYPYSLADAAKTQKIDQELLVKAGLLYTTQTPEGDTPQYAPQYRDVFNGRVTIPVCDNYGRPIGFTARRTSGSSKKKYINTADTPIFEKSKILMNWDKALAPARGKQQLIIVEGPLDLLRMVELGIKQTVCTMGTAMSTFQAEMIAEAKLKKIILFGDGDQAGELATVKRGEKLLLKNQNVYAIKTPEGEDPETMGKIRPKATRSAIDNPPTILSFIFQHTNPKDSMEKAELGEYFTELLSKISDETRRALLSSEIQSLLQVPFSTPERKTLPTITLKKQEETSTVPRIELDIIWAVIEHWDNSAVVELVLNLLPILPIGVFSDLGRNSLRWLMDGLERCNGNYSEVLLDAPFSEGIAEVCSTALKLNKDATPDWSKFLREVTQWTVTEAARVELGNLKRRLDMKEDQINILAEYVEVSRRRLSDTPE